MMRLSIRRACSSWVYRTLTPTLTLTLTPAALTWRSARSYSTPADSQRQRHSGVLEEGVEVEPLPRALAPSTALLLLSLPVAPKHWPSHLDLYSTLYRRAARALKPAGVVVNCIYDGVSGRTSFDGEEVYPARLFGEGGRVVVGYPRFGLDSIERVKADLASEQAESTEAGGQVPVTEVLVCTHGSRDCRCSDHGGALVDALRQEIGARGLEGTVTVGEIAHVGGHKYAANALVLPSLDMYSNLRHSDAGALIDHLLSTSVQTSTSRRQSDTAAVGYGYGYGYDVPSPFWAHWRGKYGSSEVDQAAIGARIDPARGTASAPTSTSTSTSTATSTASASGSTARVAEDTTASSAVKPEQSGALTFRTWEGERLSVPSRIGDTLLQVARREDLPSMEGTCGGNLECSTCHLYVPRSAPVAEASDDELDMLDYALGYREGQSRLGCQITVDRRLLDWCAAGGELGLPRY